MPMLKRMSLSCVCLLLLRASPSWSPILPINGQLYFAVGTEALVGDHRFLLFLVQSFNTNISRWVTAYRKHASAETTTHSEVRHRLGLRRRNPVSFDLVVRPSSYSPSNLVWPIQPQLHTGVFTRCKYMLFLGWSDEMPIYLCEISLGCLNRL